MSVNEIMAVRSAILNRNAALRDTVGSSQPMPGSDVVGRSTFDTVMNSALQKADSSNPVVAGNALAPISSVAPAADGGFGSTFTATLQTVNAMNARAGALTVAYERGEETDLVKVMLARQVSSLGFEATLQVRNKLLSAYRDIMNMPI